MLLRNGTSLGTNSVRHQGGTVYSLLRNRWTAPGAARGLSVGSVLVPGARTAGRPAGYGGEDPGAAWVLPLSGGGLSTYETMDHGHELEASMAQGINLLAELEADGEISLASLATVVSMVCEMVSAAQLDAAVVAAALLASTLVADGDLDGTMGALAILLAELEADGGLDDSVLSGTSAMAAEMTTEGGTGEELTAAAIARAVWDEVAAGHSDAGTTGAELQRITKIVRAILGMSS